MLHSIYFSSIPPLPIAKSYLKQRSFRKANIELVYTITWTYFQINFCFNLSGDNELYCLVSLHITDSFLNNINPIQYGLYILKTLRYGGPLWPPL